MAALVVAPLLSFVLAIIVCVLWNDTRREAARRGERHGARSYKLKLLAELEDLRDRYTKDPAATGNAPAASRADFSCVRNHATSLGLLTRQEASAAMEAYTTYVEQMARLDRRAGAAAPTEASAEGAQDGPPRHGEEATGRIVAALDRAIATLRAVPLVATDDQYPHLTSWLSPRRRPQS